MLKTLTHICATGACLFLLTVLPFSANSQKAAVRAATETITPALMQAYIGFLASDSLLGRNTPSPGLDTAAAYIARHFRDFGLQPLNGTWFQDLDFCYADLGEGNRLTVTGPSGTRDFELKSGFVPYEMTSTGEVIAAVVFAGYGITAPEFNYDDYAGLDVKGKIVLVLRQEPGQSDSTISAFKGKEMTSHSWLKEKLDNAVKHGAAGLMVVSGPLNYTSMKPRGYPWPSLSKTLPRDVLPLTSCDDAAGGIPVVQVGADVVTALGLPPDNLLKIQQEIDRTLRPVAHAIEGREVTLKTVLKNRPLGGRNVIGYLEGSDPALKNEVVVIGAHYDHVGFIPEHKADTDYIYNGADDNASGTSGVMAVAKAFTAMKERPKRSVLFMAFAGEEKGLLGSATYVKHPLIPLENTVAMLNLDMIGRKSADSLMIIGARQNPGLSEVIRKENRKIGLKITFSKNKRMGGGSDHYSFYRKDVPAVFFFTGIHDDYHQVYDNPDRIDAAKASRVARLAFLTAWKIANEDARYEMEKELIIDN
jgi:hypothetical protein